jgi:hypothetical protein
MTQCNNSSCELENGDKFKGNFTVKFIDGTMEYKNGDVYIGEFSSNKKHGHGVLICKNGDKYDGIWEDDVYFGKGTMHLANGQMIHHFNQFNSNTNITFICDKNNEAQVFNKLKYLCSKFGMNVQETKKKISKKYMSESDDDYPRPKYRGALDKNYK